MLPLRPQARWLLVALALGLSAARAQTMAPNACPMYHCAPEATGVMASSLVAQVSGVKGNNSLGDLKYQGCSGNGQRLACLYTTDTATGSAAGTLKLIDATTLLPIWGSAGVPNSYDPVAKDTSGQVPLYFDDGRVAAGDAGNHALYDASGTVIARLALAGTGNNFGLTPIAPGLAVASQNDGVLTLIDLANWRAIDSLTLREPASGARISLYSPSAANAGTLYATGTTTRGNRGWLFAVDVDPNTRRLSQRAAFGFSGRSAAGPVVLSAAMTGLPGRLLLFHAPGLNGDIQNRLLAVGDDGVSLASRWAIDIGGPMRVSPSVDSATRTVFFVYGTDPRLYQHDMLTGAPVRSFDMQALSGLPATFALNGHLAAVQDNADFTLLLSASVSAAPGRNGQYVMAFAPVSQPASLGWMKKIASRGDSATAAWNLAPSSRPGVACPVVVGSTSGLTRLCDF